MRVRYILPLFFVCANLHGETLREVLLEHGVAFDSNAIVTKDQRFSGSGKKQHLIEAESPAHDRLQIKILGPLPAAVAAAIMEDEKTALKKLSECPQQFSLIQAPVAEMGAHPEAILGAANDKYVFGACSEQAAKYKAAFITYYDVDRQTLWSWRIFRPWHDKSRPLNSAWLDGILPDEMIPTPLVDGRVADQVGAGGLQRPAGRFAADYVLSRDCANTVRSVRFKDRWKLIQNIAAGRNQLYDLKSDPYEKSDLIESKPETAWFLEQYLIDHEPTLRDLLNTELLPAKVCLVD